MSAVMKIKPQANPKPNLQLIRNTESFYELLFDEANDAILIVDCDTGKIQSANRRMQELTGYVKAELEGNSFEQLFPDGKAENTKKVRSQLFQADMLNQSGFYEDIALLKKDGYLAFATLSVKTLSPEKTGGGNVSFCILHDMGLKKSMERDLLTKHMELKNAFAEQERAHIELKSAQEALVQAGKLAALGELAAGVAHELNQPLSGVVGFIQELQGILKEKFPDAQALDFSNEVLKNGIRMKKIIQQLREFTRKSTEDYRQVDVMTVIHESFQLLDQQLKTRGITVSIAADTNLVSVYCNPFQLEQVFINLATNARDAIEATDRGSGTITIEVKKKNHFVDIVFKDDGCGMSLETKGRAFDPFYTTKEVGKGTGLGLSVSYGILSKIHGTMMIESTPGRGAIFRLRIPTDYRTIHQENTKEG
jgi:PAS domain S-box-containing protein